MTPKTLKILPLATAARPHLNRLMRKSEIVRKSGALPAASIRKPTSSLTLLDLPCAVNAHAVAVHRSFVIIRGSYGGCPEMLLIHPWIEVRSN